MIRKLSFASLRDRCWTLLLDGTPRMDEPLNRASAQLFVRLLQGWIPQNLGLERVEWVPNGKPIPMGGSMSSVPVRPTSVVWVTLPGGSRPEVDLEWCEGIFWDQAVPFGDEWRPVQAVAVFGLDEGSPIVLADITFSRSRVYWHLTWGGADGEVWAFTRAQYDAAIRDLLTLLGEEPILISPEEWAAATPTRVVPA